MMKLHKIVMVLLSIAIWEAMPAFAGDSAEWLPGWISEPPYDCKNCHRIDRKLVGPAWRDVAARYRDDPDAEAKLMAKVRAGGNGNWNDVTGGASMVPHMQLTDAELKRAVDFVLSQAVPWFPDWISQAPYDCKNCHRIDQKLVGPAWQDVAARYRDDPKAEAKLIAKVRAGGNGNWNDVTGGAEMEPHPQLTDAQLKKAVDFVLSLPAPQK